jgi:hypothetical protein
MTSQFATAAELMARVLGADGYSFAIIDHPMSSATGDQLSHRARIAATAIASLLLVPSSDGAG